MLRSLRPVHILVALAGLVFLALSVGMYFAPSFLLTPLVAFGSPLRAGNRAYLLTGQYKKVFNFTDDSPVFSTVDLLVDIWAFDASTTMPVYRRRLQTIRNGAMQNRSILGAHGKTLWILLPTGPHALNRDTGDVAAAPARIEEINPNLRGLLPVESRFLTFTAAGLAIKTLDGRTWHIHPETLLASAAATSGSIPAILPSFSTPQATYVFVQRGFALGKKWLGLLNPEEAVKFGRAHTVDDLDFQSRRALYSADITQQQTFFGPQPRYSNFRPLTDEFLAPGILTEVSETGPGALVYRRDPDSIFVLHPDRLGENGRLQLTRVTGPAGKILWTSPLQLSVLQSLMPDEQSLLLYGQQYRPQDPNERVHTDPTLNARQILVSVNWTTGAVTSRDPEATPAH
jgi:hypothetical protein